MDYVEMSNGYSYEGNHVNTVDDAGVIWFELDDCCQVNFVNALANNAAERVALPGRQRFASHLCIRIGKSHLAPRP